MLRKAKQNLALIAVGSAMASPAVASDDAPSPPSPATAYDRLSDSYTEAQREAWFESRARGQKVSWKIKILDISKGWWNYDIQGRVGSGKEVLCKVDINKANTALVADLSKGTRVKCAGTIKQYVKILGTTILIDDARIE